MRPEKVIKSTQEQAVAAWVGLLNQIRVDVLLEGLSRQDVNLSEAMDQMDWALGEIEKLVITNRGGAKGFTGLSRRSLSADSRTPRASSMATGRFASGSTITVPLISCAGV